MSTGRPVNIYSGGFAAKQITKSERIKIREIIKETKNLDEAVKAVTDYASTIEDVESVYVSAETIPSIVVRTHPQSEIGCTEYFFHVKAR
jgi:hypothetical protein